MGIEHSRGTQKLCYINAEHEEECFRNDYDQHNVFEMGFDVIQKDIVDDKHHAEMHHEFTVDPQHHQDHHDYTIDSEMLHKYGIDLDDLRDRIQDHHAESEYDVHDGDSIHGHGLDQLDQIHQYIAEKTAAYHEKDRSKQIEDSFAHKLIDYKTQQTGDEYRLFGKTMVSFE